MVRDLTAKMADTFLSEGVRTMSRCRHCGRRAKTVSRMIGFCVQCIRNHFRVLWPDIKRVHDHSRQAFGLPADPPLAQGGIPCSLCMHGCRIPEGETGFCGLRRVEGGKLKGGRPHEGNLSFYHDPLPTNCVASFVCPGGTGCGYPAYAHKRGPQYGYKNLAVFYQACDFNCLYCQNYHFKAHTHSRHRVTARELASAVDEKTACICYFGGDPTPQVLHALKTSKLTMNLDPERSIRVCWETNGAVKPHLLTRMAEVSLRSGGCVKVDLKAWDRGLHYALCGVDNRQTLENFETLAGWLPKRPIPPFLVASTLLVPGYVDETEVGDLARFIAGLNPEIPFSLLAFHPHFYLRDLPATSREHAFRCRDIAEGVGLKHVHLGNVHLLSGPY